MLIFKRPRLFNQNKLEIAQVAWALPTKSTIQQPKSGNNRICIYFVGKTHATDCFNGNFALPSSNGVSLRTYTNILRELCLSDLAVMARHYFITQKFFMIK